MGQHRANVNHAVHPSRDLAGEGHQENTGTNSRRSASQKLRPLNILKSGVVKASQVVS